MFERIIYNNMFGYFTTINDTSANQLRLKLLNKPTFISYTWNLLVI